MSVAHTWRLNNLLQVTEEPLLCKLLWRSLDLWQRFVAWLTNGTLWWLVGGTMFLAVVPFTLVVIFPTNKKLLDPSLNGTSKRATTLLLR